MSVIAAAFGDPHIRTFDDVTYTYNGKGEFILLKVDSGKVGDRYIDFVLQARYEQPKPQGCEYYNTLFLLDCSIVEFQKVFLMLYVVLVKLLL